MDLQYWLSSYISDPYNPENNFNLGLCYEEKGHTSSAAGYFLRSIEFGKDNNKIYESLLKMSLCFEKQNNRVFTIKGILLRAISLLPKRPEAYFLLARIYERNKDWQECYTTSILGYEFATDEPQTKTNVEYPGKYSFLFEKAVAGWWIGLYDESLYLFRLLKREYNLSLIYKNAVENNLKNLGNWKEPSLYNSNYYLDLKYKFQNVHTIKQNYSQCYQDMFVLSILNGKRNGTYLEIGCADPYYGNNTALLENEFGWNGISVDIDSKLVETFNNHRNNKAIQKDATKINYSELLQNNLIIDYLQIDCDPPSISYEVLQKIPFHTHKFAVITFEHDHYLDDTQSIRDKSRKLLQSFDYELVVSNISPDDYCSYEDWWVHPDLVDRNIINIMKDNSDITKKAEKYIYNRL
jgi:hypothetical protein